VVHLDRIYFELGISAEVAKPVIGGLIKEFQKLFPSATFLHAHFKAIRDRTVMKGTTVGNCEKRSKIIWRESKTGQSISNGDTFVVSIKNVCTT